MGVAGQSYNQSIETAQAAQPQKVHQKEEKGSAAEAAACKFPIKLAASADSLMTKMQGSAR